VTVAASIVATGTVPVTTAVVATTINRTRVAYVPPSAIRSAAMISASTPVEAATTSMKTTSATMEATSTAVPAATLGQRRLGQPGERGKGAQCQKGSKQ